MLRQSYPFAETCWRTVPWACCIKNREQHLYDYGFVMAHLLEQLQDSTNYKKYRAGHEPPPMTGIIESILHLQEDLDRYKEMHLSGSGSSCAEKSESGLEGLEFHDQRLLMTWWALKLFLMCISSQLAARFHAALSSLPSPAQQSMNIIHVKLQATCTDDLRDRTGYRILKTISGIVQEDSGQFESSRLIFPLTAAMLQFEHSESDLETCRRLKGQIAGNKGFKFARGLDSINNNNNNFR